MKRYRCVESMSHSRVINGFIALWKKKRLETIQRHIFRSVISQTAILHSYHQGNWEMHSLIISLSCLTTYQYKHKVILDAWHIQFSARQRFFAWKIYFQTEKTAVTDLATPKRTSGTKASTNKITKYAVPLI